MNSLSRGGTGPKRLSAFADAPHPPHSRPFRRIDTSKCHTCVVMGLAVCRHRLGVVAIRRMGSLCVRMHCVSTSKDIHYSAGTLREMDWDAPR